MSYTADAAKRRLDVMMDVETNSLTANDDTVDAPAGIMKIPLRHHQKTALKAMERLECNLTCGLDISGNRLCGDYAVLGDSVGVGKSYMILGHIARVMRSMVPVIDGYNEINKSSTSHLFSIKKTMFSNINEAGCIIIVPHTLFRQWAEYIKNTTLKAVIVDRAKLFDGEQKDAFRTAVLGADVVLISNTLYKKFSNWQRDESITWKRAFFDEADTIHMVQGYARPIARFTWFVTASWMHMLFPNDSIMFHNWLLEETVFNPASRYAQLAPHFANLAGGSAMYKYMRFYISSYSYFRDIINGTHPLRGRIVIRCSDTFIQESISLPPLYRQQVLCRSPISHQIIGGTVPQSVQNLLHAGDVAGALEQLGIKTEDTTNLIDAVTKSLQKELDRLTQTLTFKAGLDYSTESAKETALKSLQEKINGVKDKIETIKGRIEGFKSDTCPICYDEPAEPTLSPCCSHIFCGQCILRCLSVARGCPMCRETIPLNTLKKVVDNGTAPTHIVTEQLERKQDALIRIIRENPEGRFLIFSRYDNPFALIETSVVDELGLSVKQLKGNRDVIASTLAAFEWGSIRCLLLNAGYAGSGLNITAATHVILLHAMTHEEEKQILGRAYRMGRKGPLNFIRLVHSGETTQD